MTGSKHFWKVVPLSQGQLLDVRPEDVLEGGLYRRCKTYRGGGGYDKFPEIAESRLGRIDYSTQFIVQLFGCNLDCPYCYVTRAGVWGKPILVTTREMATAFRHSDCNVFHLMGGAPALQLKHWPDIIYGLATTHRGFYLFHSDLMLTEQPYDVGVLLHIARPECLFAVDVKGLTQEEHLKNTRKPFQEIRFWRNLDRLEYAKVPYYFTFTACDPTLIDLFWTKFKLLYPKSYQQQRDDAFSIDLIDYNAIKHVDDVPWGLQK